MILSKEQSAEFEALATPLMRFLNTLSHPHVTVVVDLEKAELSEGLATTRLKEVAAPASAGGYTSARTGRTKVHSHPILENTLKVPVDHVIIDRDDFDRLLVDEI